MDSKQVKAAFAAAGLKVRVADQGAAFRICTTSGADLDQAAALAVTSCLGLTDVRGRADAGCFNQPHELFAYKPGAIRRCA